MEDAVYLHYKQEVWDDENALNEHPKSPKDGASLFLQMELAATARTIQIILVKMKFHLPVVQGTVCLKLGMPGAVVWAFWKGRRQLQPED